MSRVLILPVTMERLL